VKLAFCAGCIAVVGFIAMSKADKVVDEREG
jgi:hypothetical protein